MDDLKPDPGTPRGDGRIRDSERARELAARSAEARKPLPEPGTVTVLTLIERAWREFGEPSWSAWRVFLKVLFALPLEPDDVPVYQRHTGRSVPPTTPVREMWTVCGRRSGKSRIAALVAVFIAVFRAHRLAPGERGTVMVLATDRRQARTVYRYIVTLLESSPGFAQRVVAKRRKESVDLTNNVSIEIHTSSYRSVRGYTLLAAICDELAFWSDETTANPDKEVLDALRPGMLSQPEALLLVTSSPYAQRGELYRASVRCYGRDDPRVLVWNADSLAMNATLDRGEIAQAFADDPAWAASEYGSDGHVQFRADVQGVFELAAVQAVTIGGRRELPPVRGTAYVAFADPAGGSGGDSFTLAIAHAEAERVVVDLVREVRPRFSPEDVVREFAAVLKPYDVHEVIGDRYAGDWPREAFQRHGITYRAAAVAKSDLYRELLPLVNGGRVELLDVPKLTAQLVGLERRVARGGRDSIDHAPGGHDDVVNAVAGALVLVQTGAARPALIARWAGSGPVAAAEQPTAGLGFDADALARAGGVWMPGMPLPSRVPEDEER